VRPAGDDQRAAGRVDPPGVADHGHAPLGVQAHARHHEQVRDPPVQPHPGRAEVPVPLLQDDPGLVEPGVDHGRPDPPDAGRGHAGVGVDEREHPGAVVERAGDHGRQVVGRGDPPEPGAEGGQLARPEQFVPAGAARQFHVGSFWSGWASDGRDVGRAAVRPYGRGRSTPERKPAAAGDATRPGTNRRPTERARSGYLERARVRSANSSKYPPTSCMLASSAARSRVDARVTTALAADRPAAAHRRVIETDWASASPARPTSIAPPGLLDARLDQVQERGDRLARTSGPDWSGRTCANGADGGRVAPPPEQNTAASVPATATAWAVTSSSTNAGRDAAAVVQPLDSGCARRGRLGAARGASRLGRGRGGREGRDPPPYGHSRAGPGRRPSSPTGTSRAGPVELSSRYRRSPVVLGRPPERPHRLLPAVLGAARPAVLPQVAEHLPVPVRAGDDQHVPVVLGRRPDHARAADVDLSTASANVTPGLATVARTGTG
jgi:hypothetical protein